MKLSLKGIGWLIFGVIVCASSSEASGFMSQLSTIALGCVFIVIYIMKQFFQPRGLGWYIAGGMLLAFCVESGYNSDTLISLVIGLVLLAVFYVRNREPVDAMMDGVAIEDEESTDPLEDFSYLDPDTYPDPEPDSAGTNYDLESVSNTDLYENPENEEPSSIVEFELTEKE